MNALKNETNLRLADLSLSLSLLFLPFSLSPGKHVDLYILFL